jgi:hypothetical protein
VTDSQRNLLILLAVAVAGVLFSGAFGVGAGIASIFLNVAFTVMLVWFAVILYQRHSGTIASMPHLPRLVLQVATIALILAFATGTLSAPFLPEPFGWSHDYALPFWALIFACGFAIWWAWQQRTSRW